MQEALTAHLIELIERNQFDANRYIAIVGADSVPEATLLRLSAITAERRIRLVLIFEKFGETAKSLVGKYPTVIMQMSTDQEGSYAASLIGREESFRLASIVQTQGSNKSNSHTQGESRGESFGRSFTDSGINTSSGETHGSSTSATQGSGTSESVGRTEERAYDFVFRPDTIKKMSPQTFLFRDTSHPGIDLCVGNLIVNKRNADVAPAADEIQTHELKEYVSWLSGSTKISKRYAQTAEQLRLAPPSTPPPVDSPNEFD